MTTGLVALFLAAVLMVDAVGLTGFPAAVLTVAFVVVVLGAIVVVFYLALCLVSQCWRFVCKMFL